MLLPLAGWALTGAVFFLKPGYAGAYELLQIKTYPLDSNISVVADSSWLEARVLKTVLGEHLLVRNNAGWNHLDPRTLQPKAEPSMDQVRELVTDAFSGNARYGSISRIDGTKIETDAGIRIELDWNRLSLTQRGRDTDRLDALYRIHYLQWTGIRNLDKVLGAIGILLVFALSFLGARLLFQR